MSATLVTTMNPGPPPLSQPLDWSASVSPNHVTVTGDMAFADFYEQAIDPLTRALTATIGDVPTAQDAAQEAMLRACARWNKIAGYDNPMGWCFRVGLNWATSRWRRRRREELTSTFDASHILTELEPSDFALFDAVHELPIEWRSVVVLRLLMDWSVAETAAALDVRPGTVKSRLGRAVARLRVVLDDRPATTQPAPEAAASNSVTRTHEGAES